MIANLLLKITSEERRMLLESKHCEACGHLEALHNNHCCQYCKVPGCKCEWGEINERGPRIGDDA